MERNDQIRKEILFQLYAVRPLALTPDRIHRDAKKSNYDFTLREIQAELAFLLDGELVVKTTESAVTAPSYRIHALGVTHYEQSYAA